MDENEQEYWLEVVEEAQRRAKRASKVCKDKTLSFRPEDRDGVYESCMDIDAAEGRPPSVSRLEKLNYRLLEDEE